MTGRAAVTFGARLVLGLATVVTLVSGCRAERAPGARLPNPAVVKCRDDGWRTEPVLVNGVPTGTICIEPATGRRCEAWSYFRKECPAIQPPAAEEASHAAEPQHRGNLVEDTQANDFRENIRAILQLLLNAPELSRYYHFDAMPERLPLKLVNRTSLDLGSPELTVEGEAVVLLTEPDGQSLELRAFTVTGNSAEVAFEYPAEGLVGTGLFREMNGGWSLDRLSVAER